MPGAKSIQKPVSKPVQEVRPAKKIKQQQPKQTQQVKPVEKTVQKIQAVEKPAPKPVEKKVEKNIYNPNSPEMLNYKSGLRAALFSKFAVGSIQGSGSCDIEFAIDKTGKLINRKFTHESSNKGLNDTVYYMLMSVPRYNPPPSGYNGETIRMNFTINNGNYEISIH